MRVLTVNAGSSSLKLALYAVSAAADERLASATVERAADQASAFRAALAIIRKEVLSAPLHAVAHRIVHGGARYRDPQIMTSEVVAELQKLTAIDPDHMPQSLAIIRTAAEMFPGVPQIGCFDTGFHQSLPRVAQMYALPRRFWDAGVRRYGFHGLSCEFIMRALTQIDPSTAGLRVIIAHLGSGASLTAVHNDRSLETTMGFSPTGGVVMGTRTGDLDPGVALYALQNGTPEADALSRLVNRESGLLGLSETSQDMRDLLAREADDARAADAIAMFCYSTKKAIGSLVAVLGGVDTLVFTGGIGEHAAPVRRRICSGLGCFGIDVDDALNAASAPVVSPAGAAVTLRVIRTDEDLMLARHARAILAAGGPDV